MQAISLEPIVCTKWIGTALLIAAAAFNSLGMYPIGPVVSAIGGVLWTIVAITWKDTALIVTNLTLTSVLVIGLIINLGVN